MIRKAVFLLVYDAQTGLLYVGHGGSSPTVPGRIAVVNNQTNSVIDNLPASAHPEALHMDPEGKTGFCEHCRFERDCGDRFHNSFD